MYVPLCRDSNGLTPLHLSSRYGHHEIVSTLLMYSVSPNIRDIYGWTAMHYAAANGHVEVVKNLSSFMSYNVNPVSYVEGWTPLHLACEHGNYDVVKFLLPLVQNKSLTSTDESQDTTLERAIHNKHQCIANYILQESSDTLNAVKDEDIKISDVSLEEVFQFDQMQMQRKFACVANSYPQYVNVFYENGVYDVIHFPNCDCAHFCRKVEKICTKFGIFHISS